MKNQFWAVYPYSRLWDEFLPPHFFHSYEKAYKFAKEYAREEWPKDGNVPEDFDEDYHTWEDLIEARLTKFNEIEFLVEIRSMEFDD